MIHRFGCSALVCGVGKLCAHEPPRAVDNMTKAQIPTTVTGTSRSLGICTQAAKVAPKWLLTSVQVFPGKPGGMTNVDRTGWKFQGKMYR